MCDKDIKKELSFNLEVFRVVQFKANRASKPNNKEVLQRSSTTQREGKNKSDNIKQRKRHHFKGSEKRLRNNTQRKYRKHSKTTEKQAIKMEFNPVEKAIRNDSCATFKANKFMISRLKETIQGLRSEMKMESYQKKNFENQKAEIIALKNKCVHLEEGVAFIKNSTLIQEGENSICQGKKQRSYQEHSINQN